MSSGGLFGDGWKLWIHPQVYKEVFKIWNAPSPQQIDLLQYSIFLTLAFMQILLP
jgi:hypothetical protein